MKSYYKYTPSLDAAIVVAVLYMLAFVGTFVQFLRYRSWVWTVMVVASGMESGGYITRCFSTKNVYNRDLYIVSFCLIVLAPVLMSAACYVVFGRIIFHVVPKQFRTARLIWAPPRFLTPMFIVGDIVALLLQLWGAVQITSIQPTDSNAASKASRGRKIAQTGVAIQLICFGLFSLIAVRFHFTSKRFATSFDERITRIDEKSWVTIDGEEKRLKKNWQALLRVTNIATAAILIRSAYRMVDFSLGRTGYTETHEWCIYIFDALVIFPVVTLYIYWHPSKYLPYLGFRLPKHAR